MKNCTIKYFVLLIIKLFFLFNIFCNITNIYAQQSKIDSLNNLIRKAAEDTVKIPLYDQLGVAYREEKKIDSSVLSFKKALEINAKGNYWPLRECYIIGTLEYMLYEMGNFSESLKYASRHLVLSEQLKDTVSIVGANLVLGHNYRELGDYRRALNYFLKARAYFKIYDKYRNPIENAYPVQCIGEVYLKMQNLDSALLLTRQAYDLAIGRSYFPVMLYSVRVLGDIYMAKANLDSALFYYREYVPGYVIYKERNRDLGFVLNSMAKIFRKRGQMDSVVFYATKAYENAVHFLDQENIFQAAKILSDYYYGKDEHASFNYFKIATKAKDSMITSDKLKHAQLLSLNEDIREKERIIADAKEEVKRKMSIWIAAILVSIISFLIWYRIRQVQLKYKFLLEQKESEKIKIKYEKMLLDLEAKALRAQMNPHFIFNCLNSIKSLIQQHEEEKSITYLTTFSKLIRTLFNNADKKEISLFDEIETCRYYLQLEAMRFDSKFSYQINIDESVDLKSVFVPALIVQPFIENAIWHGIVPRNNGGKVILSVSKQQSGIEIIVDDDGIGREYSKQNKSASALTHQSKGVNLTEARLHLNNLLQQRQAKLEIIDKKDANGSATGTTVIIKIKEELS